MGTANGIWHEPFTHPVRSLTHVHSWYERFNFNLFTHFTPKIKLITFLNEWVKISPRRSFYHTCNRRCQDDLNTSFAWWKCNKHNSFSQSTSLKRRHSTFSLPQWSPAPLAVQCSSSRTYCLFHMSQHVSMCLSLHSLAVIGLTCLPYLLWWCLHDHAMFKIWEVR